MKRKKRPSSKADFPVLIAEDNKISRKFLEKLLLDAGYTVVSAGDGRQAWEIFSERFFPIVLSDWMMPGMSGVDLCKTIRAHPNKSYVFIVLLTAKDKKEDIIAGLEAGADDYLTKPVNKSELIARLNTGIRILELEKHFRDANQRIRTLSITDPLTRCFNRGYMSKKLTQEIKRGLRYNHPLSIIFCDLDHFKNVNDTYGHQAGDAVLKEFSKCIFESIRTDIDWITRYGGEEFLVVLPETNLEGALCVAERIRFSTETREFKWQQEPIHLTASFGVTGIDGNTAEEDVSPDILLQKADKNLYLSKNNGRNQITITPL